MSQITCIVDAGAFRQALKKVLKAAVKRGALPVLEEAHIRFDGQSCTLTCTDLELWCQASVPAQGGPCAFVLTGSRKLLSACKYFSGSLELSYTEDREPEGRPHNPDGQVTIRCGNKEFCRRVTTANDFPEIPQVEAEHCYDVDAGALSRRFERIKYAIAANEYGPCNCCIKFFDNRIGAVDSYRLAVSQDPALRVEVPFFLPPSALKLLPVFDGAACRLLVGKRLAVFEGGGVRVLTKIPEGEGIDFDKTIPHTCLESYTAAVPELIKDLQYLNEFNLHPDKIPIRFDGGELSIGTAQGKCSARPELSGIPQTAFGFKGGYMLEGLKQFQAKGVKTIVMQLTSPIAPIILTDYAGDLAMILPHRPSKAA